MSFTLQEVFGSRIKIYGFDGGVEAVKDSVVFLPEVTSILYAYDNLKIYSFEDYKSNNEKLVVYDNAHCKVWELQIEGKGFEFCLLRQGAVDYFVMGMSAVLCNRSYKLYEMSGFGLLLDNVLLPCFEHIGDYASFKDSLLKRYKILCDKSLLDGSLSSGKGVERLLKV